MERGLQLQSLIKSTGQLEVSLVAVPIPEPGPDEVLLRIEATPINPSDMGLLFGPADMSKATVTGAGDQRIVTAPISEAGMKAVGARLDRAMVVGNEGAGPVIKAGTSAAAQALLGKTVAVLAGAMYAQYRCVKAADCLVLPADVMPAQGASCFINPLTALGMVETMRMEGHKALIHTAAASNLGQMLNKICLKDGIGLVNIVRRNDQAQALKTLGAVHICDSSSPSFMADLIAAVTRTGASLAFDAIGGGTLVNQVLIAMEAAANAGSAGYSRYGSTLHKQVYIYGGLDTRPTELTRSYGMAWGVGGWLVMPFLQKIGNDGRQRLQMRVLAELKTSFASHYTRQITLAEMLSAEAIAVYNKRGTAEKYLVTPSRG